MEPSEKVLAFADKYHMSISLALSLMIEMFDEEAFAKSDLVKKVPMSIDELLRTFSEEQVLRKVDKHTNTKLMSAVRKPTRKTKYPWDKWLDGKSHTLTKGKDFKSSIESIQSGAHGAAYTRDLVVVTKRNGNSLILQSHKKRKK